VADLYDLDRALADRLFGGAPEDDPFVGEAVIRGLFRIANVFDVTPRTVKRWIATGRLRVHRVGRHAGSKPTLYLTVSEAIEVLRDMAATVQP
jgi:hypothetical protein